MKLDTYHCKRAMLIYYSRLLTGGMNKKVQSLHLILISMNGPLYYRMNELLAPLLIGYFIMLMSLVYLEILTDYVIICK